MRRNPKFRTALGIAIVVAVMAAFDPRQFVAFLARGVPAGLPEYASPNLPRYSPFTASFATSVVPLLFAGAALCVLAARVSGRMRETRNLSVPAAADTLGAGENGRSAIEFVLLLPILLSILMLVLQVALMVQAKFVVNYAAFCSVRSAIVTIPAEPEGGEARNHIDRTDPNSDKMQTIWRAAALACVPISPHYSSQIADRTGISDATSEQKDAADRIARFFPSDGDSNVADSFKDRFAYAFDASNTTIEIVPDPGSATQTSGDFRDHDQVTVRVTHRYFLGIPLASRLMGTSFGVGLASGFYYPITEQYTLLNEGEPLGS